MHDSTRTFHLFFLFFVITSGATATASKRWNQKEPKTESKVKIRDVRQLSFRSPFTFGTKILWVNIYAMFSFLKLVFSYRIKRTTCIKSLHESFSSISFNFLQNLRSNILSNVIFCMSIFTSLRIFCVFTTQTKNITSKFV